MIHANIIARDIDDPLCNAYSFLSGRSCELSTAKLCEEFEDPDSLYTIFGLPPGVYTIEVEEVVHSSQALTLAPSLVDPFISGDAELWNSNDSANEEGLLSSEITVEGGKTISEIDIILNGSEELDDRVKFIPLNIFNVGPATLCPITPEIDYAALIGIDEGSQNPTVAGCSLIR